VTSDASATPLLERNSTFWMVAALIAMLFAITNLPWHLDDYDQAKQAFTSFEMVHEGHWLYQHTPNEKIATKPPLVGWISAAVYGLLRSWDLAWRIPSLAAAFALLFVLTRSATAAYGATAGLIAMSAFGLNLLSPRRATLVRTDMPLALVVFLLGLRIWTKVRSGEPWHARDRLIMFGLLTAAMLIKGPIVYAFLLPGIVAFQWRDQSANAWCGWSPCVASLAVFLAWAAGGIAWVPGFYEQVVLKEFAGRFGETVHRSQPLYFYLPHLLHKFAPWSVLAIALAVISWRSEQLAFAARWRSAPPDVVWLLCWALGGLILMSLIPSKRVDRVFPVIPPLCLLLGAQESSARSSAALRRWLPRVLIFACVFTSGYAAHKVITGYRADDAALVRFGRAVREQAAANGWRYEVIGGREEGLLLYLDRTRFLTQEGVVELWTTPTAGRIDAVVAPDDQLPALLQALPGAAPTGLEATVTINGRPRRYVLLKR
jgi:4-amino-4-deoxy-L-arabinose transferase-like glycosyltransferase